MKALGMIETIGLVGAIEALDAALKTADVEILNRHIIKGGIVTVEIVGDVGAIKVAVEAGAEAAKRLGVFVGSHVIARPDEMVFKMIEQDSVVHHEEETENKSQESIDEKKPCEIVEKIETIEVVEIKEDEKSEEVVEIITTTEKVEEIPKIQEVEKVKENKTEKTEKNKKNKSKKK